jgi:hypothetical protein
LQFEKNPSHSAKAALALEGPGVTAFAANAHLGDKVLQIWWLWRAVVLVHIRSPSRAPT